MSKIIFKYTKESLSIYLGHLEVAKVFERAFRRHGVQLKYTQGFNPTPKLSFAAPLSVGISSICELGLIETKFDILPQKLFEIKLPSGMKIIDAKEYNSNDSLMKNIESAEYLVSPGQNFDPKIINKFASQTYYEWVKTTKRNTRTLNMMDYILDLKVDENDNTIMKLKISNDGALNPKVLCEAINLQKECCINGNNGIMRIRILCGIM